MYDCGREDLRCERKVAFWQRKGECICNEDEEDKTGRGKESTPPLHNVG